MPMDSDLSDTPIVQPKLASYEPQDRLDDRVAVIARELIINLTTGPGGRFVPDADKPRLAAGGAHLAWPAARDLIFSTFSQHHGPSHEPA